MIIVVKPRPGIILHNPGNFMRLIDAEGSPVVLSGYWQRRINDGDAIVVPETSLPASEPILSETERPGAPDLSAPQAAPVAQAVASGGTPAAVAPIAAVDAPNGGA